MAEAVAPGHAAGHEREGASCHVDPVRAGPAWRLPVGERLRSSNLFQSACKFSPLSSPDAFFPGHRKLLAQRGEANVVCHAAIVLQHGGGFLQLDGRAVTFVQFLEAIENVVAFKISVRRDVVATCEISRVGLAQDRGNFARRPDVEFAFLALRIGVERCAKGAVRRYHLAGNPADSFLGALAEQRVAASLVGERQQFENLRIVVEHLFKMRHEPFLV